MVVVGEEIRVDRDRQQKQRPQWRVVGEAEVEQPPASRNVAADRGVHETGKQRHSTDPEDRRVWINPRTDGRLEDLHDRADDVEQCDDLGLVHGFETPRQHGDLNGNGGEEQEVIAAERSALRIPKRRCDDERDQRAPEQAGPGLLDAEPHEFVDKGRGGPLARPPRDPLVGGDEASERCPVRRRAPPVLISTVHRAPSSKTSGQPAFGFPRRCSMVILWHRRHSTRRCGG